MDCSGIDKPRLDEQVACRFNYSALTEQCNEKNGYGMLEGKPCILLKLNKVRCAYKYHQANYGIALLNIKKAYSAFVPVYAKLKKN